jgi:hypothetical protein
MPKRHGGKHQEVVSPKIRGCRKQAQYPRQEKLSAIDWLVRVKVEEVRKVKTL